MNPDELLAALRAAGVTHEQIATAIGRNRVVATRLMNGQRNLKVSEIEPLRRLLEEARPAGGVVPAIDTSRAYVGVDILPTFAGAGGGGTGDGDIEQALIPRSLIEDQLHGRPENFALVEVRGDSMEPDFSHGDQLLVDKRDRDPTQAGPFAIWHNDSYMIRNLERLREGLRVFPTNMKYTEDTITQDDIIFSILGRPVWFGRRL